MTAPDFTQIMRLAEEIAAGTLVDSRRQLPPTWILFRGSDSEILLTPWSCDLEKQLAFADIRRRLTDPMVEAYALVDEVWFVVRHGDTGLDDRGFIKSRDFVRVRDDPKRQEAVLCHAATRAWRMQCVWQIVRDWKGTVRMLRPDPDKTVHEPSDGRLLRGAIPEPWGPQ